MGVTSGREPDPEVKGTRSGTGLFDTVEKLFVLIGLLTTFLVGKNVLQDIIGIICVFLVCVSIRIILRL